MGFKTYTVGEKLTAATLNAEVRDQVVSQVTSTTRPPSPQVGQMIYETDTTTLRMWTGSVWRILVEPVTYRARTPSLTNVTTPKHNLQRFVRVGISCKVSGVLVIDTLSGITGTITIELPFVSANIANLQGYVGSAWYLDAGNRHYPGSCYVSPNSAVLNLVHTGSGNAGLVNATNPFTFLDGDVIGYALEYETVP